MISSINYYKIELSKHHLRGMNASSEKGQPAGLHEKNRIRGDGNEKGASVFLWRYDIICTDNCLCSSCFLCQADEPDDIGQYHRFDKRDGRT